VFQSRLAQRDSCDSPITANRKRSSRCRDHSQVVANSPSHSSTKGFEEVGQIGIGKSASVYQWSSGDCRFGMSDGQNESCSGPEVSFEDIIR
jgi:hypothetical protein